MTITSAIYHCTQQFALPPSGLTACVLKYSWKHTQSSHPEANVIKRINTNQKIFVIFQTAVIFIIVHVSHALICHSCNVFHGHQAYTAQIKLVSVSVWMLRYLRGGEKERRTDCTFPVNFCHNYEGLWLNWIVIKSGRHEQTQWITSKLWALCCNCATISGLFFFSNVSLSLTPPPFSPQLVIGR